MSWWHSAADATEQNISQKPVHQKGQQSPQQWKVLGPQVPQIQKDGGQHTTIVQKSQNMQKLFHCLLSGPETLWNQLQEDNGPLTWNILEDKQLVISKGNGKQKTTLYYEWH